MILENLIRHAVDHPRLDEGGEPINITLTPGLSESAIAEFAASLPCTIPRHIAELLRFCQGFEHGITDAVDFTGETMPFGYPEAFPHGIPIASDGFGNFWVVDIARTSTDWAPIYFACHDAPIILYQCASLREFLTALLSPEPDAREPIDAVHEDAVFQVWRQNPGVLPHAQCLQSSDASLQAFAQQLDPTFQIIDLRTAPVGFGFSWGRYGPDTVVRRYGLLPIFAYQRKVGLLRRLIGRSEDLRNNCLHRTRFARR